MPREVKTEIDINASATQVWKTITDFDAFSKWNPFIVEAHGEAKQGANVKIVMRLHIGLKMPLSAAIIKFKPEGQLCWIGHLLVPGLVDGEHCLRIEPVTECRVTFVQHEIFTGALVPIFWPMLRRNANRGFEAMNRALKSLLEENGKPCVNGDVNGAR